MRKTLYPWTPQERKLIKRFRRPIDIQAFLDQADYNKSAITLFPGEVLRKRKAHCFDGALFAAMVMNTLGHPALLMDLRAVRDDDHVLCIFKRGGCFGAIAKSNYTGLRYREPIYRSLRELAVSYFDGYFNLKRERSLREFSELLDLRTLKPLAWDSGQAFFFDLATKLDSLKHHRIFPKATTRGLTPVDLRSFRAGKLGRR